MSDQTPTVEVPQDLLLRLLKQVNDDEGLDVGEHELLDHGRTAPFIAVIEQAYRAGLANAARDRVEELPRPEPMGPMHIDRKILAGLVEAALTTLPNPDDDLDPDDDGCCPHCCAACGSLKALLDAGQLDEAVIDREYDWWDAKRDQVSRERLAWVWRSDFCPNPHTS